MLKESKIRVLENFYALDYIFFGKSINEVEMCCPLVKEEYLSVKGALMSVFVEMLKILDHNPMAIDEHVDSRALLRFARSSAAIARENSQKIVTSPKARANIKEALQEAIKEDPDVNVSEVVEKAIRMKAFGLAIDNLMVARSLTEADQPDQLNTWEGRIIEDSYKILRDNLVESAYQILYDVTDDDEKKVSEGKKLDSFKQGAKDFATGAAIGAAASAVGIGAGVAALRYKAKRVCDRRYTPGTPEYQKCVREIMKHGTANSREVKRDKKLRKQGK